MLWLKAEGLILKVRMFKGNVPGLQPKKSASPAEETTDLRITRQLLNGKPIVYDLQNNLSEKGIPIIFMEVEATEDVTKIF